MKMLLLTMVSLALASPAAAQTPRMIQSGNVLSWSASSGHDGRMKIVAVDGAYFEVDQTNDKNRAAGTIRLYGAVLDHGRRIVLLNVGQWKEVWEGEVRRDEISGSVTAGSSSFTFRITPARERPEHDDAPTPFVQGRTLRWSSDAAGGQNGTVHVVAARGSRFVLEQKNEQNVAAGITRLEGEVKGDRVYIYNKQWKETWVGTFTRDGVSGRINDRYGFRIWE
jgi:hypothetical protein